MNLHNINPLIDPRWQDLVRRHPRASVFHRREWLQALHRTYGYEPLAFTSTAPGEPLRDAVVACHVRSWMFGPHLVSLPFSDHCEPLLPENGLEFVESLKSECAGRRLRYLELRPLYPDSRYGEPSASYWFHELDLTPSLEALFGALHKDSIQRSIRRAERAGLTCEIGRSETLLRDFYRLVLLTRRRHGLLPQPRAWFEQLCATMGDDLQIRLVRKDEQPIAAILAIRHRSKVVYKYGASDAAFHSLGAMPLLFWRLIEESKNAGAATLDFGRSDVDNPGLVTFKDKFGTAKRLICYYRHPHTRSAKLPAWTFRTMRAVVSLLPDRALSSASRIVYREMG